MIEALAIFRHRTSVADASLPLLPALLLPQESKLPIGFATCSLPHVEVKLVNAKLEVWRKLLDL